MRPSPVLLFALCLGVPVSFSQESSPAADENTASPDIAAMPQSSISQDGWTTKELIDAAEEGDFKATMLLLKQWSFLASPEHKVSSEVLEAKYWFNYWLDKAIATGHPAPVLYQFALQLSPEELEKIDNNIDEAPAILKNALQKCKKLAAEGDLCAIEALCHILPTPDEKTLRQWFSPLRQKAENGDKEAMADLAKAMLFGNATHESFLKEGVQLAKQSAEAGSVNGMEVYGSALLINIANDHKPSEGIKWLNKAADAGHAKAMESLLMIVHNEDEEKANMPEIKKREAFLVKSLCERGQLGYLVSEGKRLVETGESPKQGLALLDRASEIGSFSAMDALAKYYRDDGYYVPKDTDKSIKYCQKMLDAGYAVGFLKMAFHYETGQGVAKDEIKAYEYVCRAKDMGLSDAYAEQARMILKGSGTNSNPSQAFSILMSLLNDVEPPLSTYFLIGYMYDSGLGVSADDRKAVEYYTKGAEYGDPKAMNNLASLYETGKGVSKSTEQAIKWYAEAAKFGDEDAAANLKRLKDKNS